MIFQHPLRREREQRGWSQSKLAELLGTSPLSISQWERGIHLPSPYFREKLCILFEKDAHKLGLVEATRTDGELHEGIAEGQLIDALIPLQGHPAEGLIGRDSLLSSLLQKVCHATIYQMFVIHGLPGVGKTAIALALVQHEAIRTHFSGGILWAGLGVQGSIAAHLRHWSGLLQLPSSDINAVADMSSWAKMLRSRIGARKMLIVIDDAWQLEDVLALQVGGPECVYIVTTRFPAIAAQLSAHYAVPLVELEESEGFRLLARFIPRLAEREPETVRQLVLQAGMLPLALTLIGRYLHTYEYLQQPRRAYTALVKLQQAEERLNLQMPQAPVNAYPSLPLEMPLSLRATIDVSTNQLSLQEQVALYALSVFPAKPGSFSEQAALSVADIAAPVLDKLCEFGLIESSWSGRYSMHQAIVDYAYAHLAKDAFPLIAARAIHYVLAQIEEAKNTFDNVELEYRNMQALMEFAYHNGSQAPVLQALRNLEFFFLVRGIDLNLEVYLKKIYQKRTTECDIPLRMHICMYLGITYTQRGDYKLAEKFAQEGAAFAREEKNADCLCICLRTLGTAAVKHGEHEVAQAYYQEGLNLARHTQNDVAKLRFLINLGSLYMHKSSYDQAYRYCKEGMRIARELNDKDQMSLLLTNIAVLNIRQGMDEQAEKSYREALSFARQIRHQERTALILSNLGFALIRNQKYEEAENVLQEGLDIAQKLELREMICFILENMGICMLEQGRQERAKIYFQEGLVLARELRYQELLARHTRYLAHIAVDEGDFEAAESAFRDILAAVREGKVGKDHEAHALYGLCRTGLLRGDHKEDYYEMGKKSLALFEELHDRETITVKNWLEEHFSDRTNYQETD